jgi:MtaA/CmuA family methyltransferase
MEDYRSKVLEVINTHKRTELFPVAIHQTGFVEAMKKSKAFWPKAHEDPNLMAKLSSTVRELAGFVGLVVPFEITAEAHAMGAEVRMGDQLITPTVIKHLNNIEDIIIPEPTSKRLRVVGESIRILKEKEANTHPIIASVAGPYTLATLLLGVSNSMSDMIKQPEKIHEVLKITNKMVVEYDNYLVEQGADIVVLLEPVCSLIGPKYFSAFALPVLQKVIGKVKAPIVLHICGNTGPLLEDVKKSGAKGFSFDQKTDITQALDSLKGQVTMFGNLDPIKVLWKSTPEAIARKTKQIIEAGIDIPAPGCGLPPQISAQNLQSFSETVYNHKL